jgi:hypothetical protein
MGAPKLFVRKILIFKFFDIWILRGRILQNPRPARLFMDMKEKMYISDMWPIPSDKVEAGFISEGNPQAWPSAAEQFAEKLGLTTSGAKARAKRKGLSQR